MIIQHPYRLVPNHVGTYTLYASDGEKYVWIADKVDLSEARKLIHQLSRSIIYLDNHGMEVTEC